MKATKVRSKLSFYADSLLNQKNREHECKIDDKGVIDFSLPPEFLLELEKNGSKVPNKFVIEIIPEFAN